MQIETDNPTDGQALPPVQWNYDELKQRPQVLRLTKDGLYR